MLRCWARGESGRRYGALLLALVGLVAACWDGWPAYAQTVDAPGGNQAAPRASEPDVEGSSFREETVYIPYRKLQQVFEKEGRGVFLPYDKFQALWKAARRKVSEVKPEVAPVAAVIREIESRAVIGDQTVQVDATLQIDVLRKGWVVVPLRLRQSAIREATLDEQPARIVFDSQHGYQFLHHHASERPGSVTLKLRYTRAFSKTPGQSQASFEPPQAPIHRWEVAIAEPDVKIEIEPLIAATRPQQDTEGGESAKESRLVAFVGAAPSVTLRWTPRAEGAAGLAAFVTAQVQQQVHIAKGVVRTSAEVTYDISRARVRQLEFDVPPEHKIVNVFDGNVKRWDVQTEAGRQRVTVELFEPVQGRQSLSLELERFQDAEQREFEVEIPMIRALKVGRQQGVVLVEIEEGLKGEAVMRAGLSQIDRDEIPEAQRKKKWAFAYRYGALPYTLKLRMETVQPRVSVQQLIDARLQPDRIDVTYVGRFQIDDAGIFQLELEIPDGYQVQSIRGQPIGKSVPAAAVESYHRLAPEGTRWQVNLSKRALGAVGITAQLHRRLQVPELTESVDKTVVLPIGLPRAAGANLAFSEGAVLVRVPESLRVNPTVTQGLRAVSLREVGQLLPGVPIETGSGTPPLSFLLAQGAAKLEVQAAKRKPLVTVRQVLATRFEPGVVRYTARFFYDIQFSGVPAVRVDVPTALVDTIHNATPGLRRRTVTPAPDDLAEGYTAWSFSSDSELKGSHELKLTWEQKISDLKAGSSSTVALPRLIPRMVDRATGQIVVTKAEGIDIEPSGTPRGLRPIDPQWDLDERARTAGAAMAFEFVGDWNLELVARRYEPAPVKITAIERGVVRVVVLPEGRLSVQALYRIKSARQRLSIRLPAKSEFDSQPLRIDGEPVLPEQGTKGAIFVPLVGRDAETPFVLEMRYSVKGSPGRIALPVFLDEPAVQKIYLVVFLTEKMELVASRGKWSHEMSGPSLPWRTVSSADRSELYDPVSWVCDGRQSAARHSAGTFPVGRGRRYVYSTLRPAPPPDGDLRLLVASSLLLQTAVIVALALVGLPLVGRSLRSQIVLLLLLATGLSLLGVFRVELLEALIGGAFPGAVIVMGLIWGIGHVWRTGRRGMQAVRSSPTQLVAETIEPDPSRSDTNASPFDSPSDVTDADTESSPPDGSGEEPGPETTEADQEGDDDEK